MRDNPIPFKAFLPGIVWFFIICVLVFIPGNDVPKVGWMSKFQIDKAAHAALFGGLVLLFCLPYFKAHFTLQKKIYYYIRISLAAIMWGLATEFIQKFFIPGRSFELWDWAADTTGVVIAFLLARRITIKYFTG